MERYSDLILYAVFFLTSFVFPLWVSKFASKRGRPGWSKIAFFSVIIGLGFFGGLAALTAASMKPGIMDNNELEISTDASIEGLAGKNKEKIKPGGSCPKCCSNMVHRSIIVIDPATGERTKSINQEQMGTTAGTVMIVFGAAIMCFTIFRFFTLAYPIGYLAAGGIGGYFAYLGIRPWLARKREEGRQVIEVFDCARCKSTWDGLEIKN